MTWTVAPERFDTPDAALLRRDYYDEVASRYWGRPATTGEIDEGLAGDGVERLGRPTGEFLVGRHGGEPASCAGVLLVDTDTAEPGAAEHRRTGDVRAVEDDAPGARPAQPGEQVEQGGLARPVRPQDRHDLAAPHRQGDVAEDPHPADGDAEAVAAAPGTTVVGGGSGGEARRHLDDPVERLGLADADAYAVAGERAHRDARLTARRGEVERALA